MKNYLRKLGAAGLAVFCLGSQILYGAEEKPILYLEEAVKAGLTYSNQLSLNAKERELLKERLKTSQNDAYEIYQSIYLEKAKSENQTEILKDRITYDITSRYYHLVLAEEELAYLDEAISVQAKELEIMRIKKEMGVTTSIDYENLQTALQDLKNNKQAKLDVLSNDKSYFKLITGKDAEVYSLQNNLAYELYRVPGNADRYIDTIIEKYLRYDKDLAEFAKEHVIIAGMQPVFYAEYLEKKYTADKGLSALEDIKKGMKEALMDSYSSLMSLEEQMSALQTKRSLLEKQLGILKVQYESGVATRLEYDKLNLGLGEIDLQLNKLITQYNLLREVIEKPWVLVSSNEKD
ncbi:MAG: putative multidrug efflux pump, outer membrane protein [Clostridia bacterium]|jgi:hypothetical protein|nr:putative multidrug efflux pump, outer membrane protein [Clostridia bacterium]